MNILLKLTGINGVVSTTDVFFPITLQWRIKVKLYFSKFNNKTCVSTSRISVDATMLLQLRRLYCHVAAWLWTWKGVQWRGSGVRFKSSGTRRCVVGYEASDVSKDHITFIILVKEGLLILDCVNPKPPEDMTSLPRRFDSSATPQWESQISHCK